MDEELTLTIDVFGTKKWRNTKGEFHRLDGPAREFENGHREWWFNGVIHREDGPAFIFSSGRKSWYLNDVRYPTKESYFDALSDEAKVKCLFSEDFLNG
jgi:hypothetical protein